MKFRALSTVKRALLAQLSVTIVLASVLVFHGTVAAYSALLGGAIYALANAYAGWRIFSLGNDESPHGELGNIYRAEFGKLVMIGALCAATFASVHTINIVAFVVGCAASMIAGAVGASICQTEGVPWKRTRKT